MTATDVTELADVAHGLRLSAQVRKFTHCCLSLECTCTCALGRGEVLKVKVVVFWRHDDVNHSSLIDRLKRATKRLAWFRDVSPEV